MTRNKLPVKGTPPPLLDREFAVVGKPLNRRGSIEKVTGRAKYSGDIKLPGMLYGTILRCPHVRARILKLDTSKAEQLPGVKAILTKENTKGWHTCWHRLPQIAFPECITYEGQEVAAIAAENIAIAQRAVELIEVEYEILTPILEAEEALKSDPYPYVADEEYPGREIYDGKEFVIRRGDIDKGFAEADLIVEDTYTTQTQYQGMIQTRVCVASWDGHDLTVWDSVQGVWNSKGVLADSLGLDPENVRVIVEYLGGGFGSKASCQRISFYAAKLSMVTGKPVKIERNKGRGFHKPSSPFGLQGILQNGSKKRWYAHSHLPEGDFKPRGRCRGEQLLSQATHMAYVKSL
jgi:xanthine dehydrogenase molybdenum-binding subunit